MNLNISRFEEIIKEGYSLDMIYLTILIKEGHDLAPLLENNIKMNTIYQGARRKGLITEEDKLTITGKYYCDLLTTTMTSHIAMVDDSEPAPVKPVKSTKLQKDEIFEKWWKAYPGTDSFVYKEKEFKGTRALRTKKEDCKVKINSILAEGEYTIDDLISALEFEVKSKMEHSLKTKENKLSYMQNSLTYLNQRTFEPFIEAIKNGQKIKETTIGGGSTDI